MITLIMRPLGAGPAATRAARARKGTAATRNLPDNRIAKEAKVTTSRSRRARGALLAACGVMATSIAAAQGAPQGDMGFDLNVTLSEKAAASLASRNEAIVVSASYYGDPKPGARRHANEIGQIDLGREEVDIPGKPGLARITGAKVEVPRLEWLDGQVMVNVNVFTARKSGPDNLLSCDIIDGPLQKVRSAPVTLNCGLIEEGLATALKP